MTLPPGPRTPGLVNTLRLYRRPLDALVRWHDRFGDVFTVRFAVFGTGVYVADPKAIRELFTGDQSDLRAGEANSFLTPVVGPSSILVLDGPAHLRQRRLLLPPFQGPALAPLQEIVRDVAERGVAQWPRGRPFAVRPRMQDLAFEVICRAVFGVREPARIRELGGALRAVLDLGPMFAVPFLRRDLGRWSPGGLMRQRLHAADALLHEEIVRRRGARDLEERPDVLSLLLRARYEDGSEMTDRELRDELMTMLLAGHETTATGLAFALDLLLHVDGAFERLRQEVEAGNDEYVDAVVKESLRLRPVLDAAERTLTEPRTVAGWRLPAGITVYPAIALVQRRPDLYPDPGTFRPERFLSEGAESYSWIPFGGGIRRCIGAGLAQLEMAEVLRVVARSAPLRAARPKPDPIAMRGITLAPAHGVPVLHG